MRWCLFPILLLLLIGCDVPKAAPEKNPTLVIATDRLAEGDSLLFAKFGAQHKIEIVLKEMTADSIMQLYQEDRYGLGIDVILLHHAYDMRLVRNSKLLEPLKSSTFLAEAMLTESKLFITCGIDPFVCLSKKNVRINIYDDLIAQPLFMNLKHKSKTHFFAPYEERLHRAKTFERLKKLDENTVPMKAWFRDSSNAILTTYSDYKALEPEDSLWTNFTELQFPNSSTSGVFYDVLTAGVIQQSSHFKTATNLLEWLTTPEINKKLTANRGYEPIRSAGNYRRFATPADLLMQYHTMIERMLKEIE